MTLTQPRSSTDYRAAPAVRPRGLTGRDAVATILVGFAVLVVAAVLNDWDWPVIGSGRMAALAVGLAGLTACSVGARLDEQSFRNSTVRVAAALGVIAVGLFIATLVTGSEAILLWLGTVTVALWVVATVRHALTT